MNQSDPKGKHCGFPKLMTKMTSSRGSKEEFREAVALLLQWEHVTQSLGLTWARMRPGPGPAAGVPGLACVPALTEEGPVVRTSDCDLISH